MITEIDIAKKLSLINDLNVDESIVNTGRVQGINIYKEKINILIAKKIDEKEDDISKIKNYIKNSLSDYKDILIDVKEDDFKKSEISHLFNLSKSSDTQNKVNDKWNMDSHKLFGI